jgi:SPP1 gp7 family putative phage head morphogenesis protein
MDKKKPKKLPTKQQLRQAARERFLRGRKAEVSFQRQLVGVSKQIGNLVKGFSPGGHLRDVEGLRAALTHYAEIIRPWARAVVVGMQNDVSRRDAGVWAELSREMGRTLRKEIVNAPTGQYMTEALNEQVDLITSLPLEAAQRVHKLTTQALMESGRAAEIQKEIMQTGLVTASRARTIARTETSRTASLLLEGRARYVGSTHYIWHTSGDSDVRPTHKKLNRKTFAWNDPPVTEETGERAHPGQIWNCRCWAEPIIPDAIK